MTKLNKLLDRGLIGEYLLRRVKEFQSTPTPEIMAELIEIFKDYYMWDDLKVFGQLCRQYHWKDLEKKCRQYRKLKDRKIDTSISACLIVKNEVNRLQKCVDSIKQHVDEIVIVDTGSIDGTQGLAETLADRYTTCDIKDDFSAWRNASIKLATKEWVFMIDADEWLEDVDLKSEIKKMYHNSCDSMKFVYKDYRNGEVKSLSVTGIRLMRRKNCFFEYPVHNQIRGYGNIYTSDGVISSDGYEKTADNRDTRNRQTKRILEQMIEKTDGPYFHYQLGVTNSAMMNYGMAIEEFNKALENSEMLTRGNIMQAMMYKLQIYTQLKDDDMIQKSAEEVREFDASMYDLYYVLGTHYHSLHQFDRAIPFLQEYLKLRDGAIFPDYRTISYDKFDDVKKLLKYDTIMGQVQADIQAGKYDKEV